MNLTLSDPQRGQETPFGHRWSRKCSKAVCSSAKWRTTSRSVLGTNGALLTRRVYHDLLRQVYNYPIKALRDEFDVHFPSPRRGWSKLEVRPPIRRTILEMEPLSQDLHMELVRCALSDRIEELAPVAAVIEPSLDATTVAKRLLTRRLAEEWFREQAPRLFPLAALGLIDCRTNAQCFDFAIAGDAEVVVRLKGSWGRVGRFYLRQQYT